MAHTPFASVLEVGNARYSYYPISEIKGSEKLPLPLKVLLENVLRNAPSPEEAHRMASLIVEAGTKGAVGQEVEFSPGRVLFQDFTGVPVFVDFAVMREACAVLGGDAQRINPQVPCDLVIDHSVIADVAGRCGALEANIDLEFHRNAERYSFLKWAQDSFDNVRIVPPGAGICHQLNIENFASVVMRREAEDGEGLPLAYFDTLVGTDSHTPTANGIGVLGWGVGGIEAEAAALGQPITTLVPRVIGVRLSGALREDVTAMDLALTFAEKLRETGVVGCFVECFGPGIGNLSATQRACMSNMTPEYGCTCTLFPVDEQTLDYLRITGRSAEQLALVEAYSRAQGSWAGSGAAEEERVYSQVIELDLSTIEPSLAGPSRPHDRLSRSNSQKRFRQACEERGLDGTAVAEVMIDGKPYALNDGAIAIAAVTSCTTATDPAMMLSAGLLAKKAAKAGLQPKPWVKCIFAPGSKATELLLERAGLLEYFQELGFHTCGFGCMSCIGNSGPLSDEMHKAASRIELTSILSGNRNFEGRISPDVAQNYLAAPANVIAYSLAGTMDFNPQADALGVDSFGQTVFLADLLPDQEELDALLKEFVTEDLFACATQGIYEGTPAWQKLSAAPSATFSWDPKSTYVRRAPYFDGMSKEPSLSWSLSDARVLAVLGDFITTDHISPAGSIAPDSPAARYLEENGVQPQDFNTYGSRRGNHEAMMRGTFANVKLANRLAAGKKGGWTFDHLDSTLAPLFDAAIHYQREQIPCVVLAGKMYGSGSSRDWAAKGPALLGVKAVFAESYERIHRSNLIGMGVLPLQFKEGENIDTYGLDGSESFSTAPLDFTNGLPQPSIAQITAKRADGETVSFEMIVRIDTPTEGLYFRQGGILQYVLVK